MITDIYEAKIIAENYFNSKYDSKDDILIILDDLTVIKEYGWYFCPASMRYLETRNPTHMIAGGGPILIERLTGKVVPMGTARPLKYYISKYENDFIGSGEQRKRLPEQALRDWIENWCCRPPMETETPKVSG